MRLSDVVNVIKEKASELTGLSISVGLPGTQEGITLVLITGPTSEAYYNRAEKRTLGVTFHVKSSDQLRAVDFSQLIGDGLTRWNYPPQKDFQITKIKHDGAFFIAQEESTKHWIYGVSLDISIHY